MLKLINLEFIKPSLMSILPALIRLVFASTLFMFFWKSALTKFDGPFSLSVGAYGQIFPKAFEAVSADPSQLSIIYHLIAYFGGIAEFVLPFLIVIGLFTRLSAIAMIGLLAILTIVDVFGHGVATGALFDGSPYGIVADQRLYWLMSFITLAALGGGRGSLDRIIGIRDEN